MVCMSALFGSLGAYLELAELARGLLDVVVHFLRYLLRAHACWCGGTTDAWAMWAA